MPANRYEQIIAAAGLPAKPNKYRNKPETVDGHRFPSQREAKRYGELKLLERAGVISKLRLQPKFDLVVNGVHICRYFGDFGYHEGPGQEIIEDSKGYPTPEYKIKKALMLACLGINVKET